MKDTRRVILIVDDDANDRFLLERSFNRLDSRLKIRTANDGVEALAYLDAEGDYADRKRFPFPSLIFIDLKMPRLDGFSVLEHLKGHPRWAIIPTLVFTASADLDDIKKAFLLGACGYHVKPAETEERDKLCRKLLDYWATCEVPQTDDEGNQLQTHSEGKLGERIKVPAKKPKE